MGNRLSKIYTRTGDDGSTGMADGRRVSKADNLFNVMGDIDELNSHIGLVCTLGSISQQSDIKSATLICAHEQQNLLKH